MNRKFSIILIALVWVALILPSAAQAAAPTNDDWGSATVIGGLPYSTTEDTSQATAAVDDPSGCGNNGSVWYAFTPSSDMILEADTFGSDYDTVLSVFTGTQGSLAQVACNDDTNSLQSQVQFAATGGTTYYFMIAICCGSGSNGGGNLVFSAKQAARPANDDFAGAIAISGLPFTDSRDTTEATTAPDDPYCGARDATVWYKFTPTADTRIDANTLSSSYFALVSVWTGSQGALTNVACGYSQQVRFNAVAGTTYYLMVAGYGGGGNLVFSVSVAPPPLAITLNIADTGSVSPTTGVATISGTVSCNQPAAVFGNGFAQQKIGTGLVRGFFFLAVFCDSTTPTNWTSILYSQPVTQIGKGRAATLFTAGRLATNAYAFAFDPSMGEGAQSSASATVILKGSK